MKTLNVLISGASGRMGRALLRLAAADASIHVVAAVRRTRSDDDVASPHESDRGTRWMVVDQLVQQPADVPAFDVAIDFSQPAGLLALTALCSERGAALVSGTTGVARADMAVLDTASGRIPLLWAANFSLGIAVLSDLAERAAAALAKWDVDLIELHHNRKVDAPSGTALALGAAVQAGRGSAPTYHSLRAGDAVGEHSIQFSGVGERIELVHRATDRDVFARGALHAAQWLVNQPPGRYLLRDSLGI